MLSNGVYATSQMLARRRRVGRVKPLKWRVSDGCGRSWRRCWWIRRVVFVLRVARRYPARRVWKGCCMCCSPTRPGWRSRTASCGLPSGETCRRRLEEWSRRGLLAAGDRGLAGAAGGGGQARLVAGDRRCVAGRREKGGEKVARSLLGRPGSRYHLAVDANGLPLAVRLAAGNENEQRHLLPLIDELHRARDPSRRGLGRPRLRLQRARTRTARARIEPRISKRRRAGDPIPAGQTDARGLARQKRRSRPATPTPATAGPSNAPTPGSKRNAASPPAATAKPTTTSPSSTSA